MKKLTFILIICLFFSEHATSQVKKKLPQIKDFTCTTFVYNLSLDDMKMKDICFDVIKGEFIDLNKYSTIKKKENEHWRFKIEIKDNQTLSKKIYEAAFYVYENYSQDIIQYHPILEDDEFKAIIYDKTRNKWQILLYQNDEYKILSSYMGYNYTNAFGIKAKNKSSINY